MRFAEMLGQEKARRFLGQVLAGERIPHAYLFAGPAGVGKFTAARALGAALNCLRPEGSDSCGRCLVCRQMDSGNFPDFLFIEPEGQNIKIGQIREMNRRLGFAPVAGRYRLSVLRQAETMTGEAANAFLKTLEEPPPGNVFVLSAAESRELFPTILSRCQKITFQPLPRETIAKALVERGEADSAGADILARHSEGSLGRALELCGRGFLELRLQWLEEAMALAVLPEGRLLDLAAEIAARARPGSRRGQDGGGDRIPDLLGAWRSWYRDLLLTKTGAPEPLLVNADLSLKLKNTAEHCTIKNLVKEPAAAGRGGAGPAAQPQHPAGAGTSAAPPQAPFTR